jgi:hypothetical protein
MEVLFSLGDQALNLNALSQIRTTSQPGAILILLPLLGSFLVSMAYQTEVIEGLFGTLFVMTRLIKNIAIFFLLLSKNINPQQADCHSGMAIP